MGQFVECYPVGACSYDLDCRGLFGL